MKLLYNLGIHSTRILFGFAAFFNPKAKLFITGRKKLLKRISDDFQNVHERVVWVHCASLGEFEQGRPVIEAIKKEYPDVKIVLTFFSPSGVILVGMWR